MSLLDILIYTGYLALLINVIVYSVRVKNSTFSYRVFYYYLVFTLIMQALTETFAILYRENLFLSHYYFAGQFIILSIFYGSIFKSKVLKKLVLTIFTLLCISLIIIYNQSFEYKKFNLVEVLTTSIPIIIYALLYFIENIENKKKFILVNSGIFIYLISSTFLFSSGNLINSSNSSFRKVIWNLNGVVYILHLALIFIEWYKNFRKREVITK